MHRHIPDEALMPPATLHEARALRDGLSRLLAAERGAAAAFLEALVDFDARRGWEPLGHASLFGFLHAELGLSKGAAFLRFTAVRLVRRFPEVAEALRSGRLCLSAVGELARVMTPENRAEVLPRFFGCSSREARLVSATLVPRESPPMRVVITRLPLVSRQRPLTADAGEAQVPRQAAPLEPDGAARVEGAGERPDRCGPPASSLGGAPEVSGGIPDAGRPAPPAAPSPAAPAAAPDWDTMPASGLRDVAPPSGKEVRAHELASTRPAWVPSWRECEPLDGDLRRLHLTVSRGLLAKLEAARAGLTHVLPGATTEQVLEAALDLLLERQARAVQRPRRARRLQRPARKAAAATTAARTVTEPTSRGESRKDTETESRDDSQTEPRCACPGAPQDEGEGPRAGSTHPEVQPGRRQARSARTIPAAVAREVRARDGGRCQFPLDAGGVCGSTTRVQLDHVVPVALGGQATVENLRLLCAPHNLYAARLALGEAVMATARRGGAREKNGARRPGRAARSD